MQTLPHLVLVKMQIYNFDVHIVHFVCITKINNWPSVENSCNEYGWQLRSHRDVINDDGDIRCEWDCTRERCTPTSRVKTCIRFYLSVQMLRRVYSSHCNGVHWWAQVRPIHSKHPKYIFIFVYKECTQCTMHIHTSITMERFSFTCEL